MPIVVLDTDAASLLHRRELHAAHAILAITFVTLAEFSKGMEARSWGERRRRDLTE